MLLPKVSHGIRDNSVEVVVCKLVRRSTGKLQDLEVVIVDRVKRILNSAYSRAHSTEGSLKTKRVNDAFLEVELEVRNSVAERSYLPVIRVVELKSRCLVERDAVVVSVLTLSDAVITIDGKDSRSCHTVEDVLLEAGYDIVIAALVNGELIFDPLANALPLFAADSVKQGSVGCAGRVRSTRRISHGVYGLAGGSREIFCF